MHSSVLHTGLVLAVLSSSATAQYLATPQHIARDLPLDKAGPAASPQAGDFNGDVIPDLAYVDEGTGTFVVVWSTTGIAQYTNSADSGILGVSAIAALDVATGADGLIAVGPGGARLVAYDETSQSFVTNSIPSWSGVRQVVAEEHSGGHFIAGLNDAGDEVRAGVWSPATGFTALATIATSGALDVAIADWEDFDSAVDPEIIVRTQNELLVHDPITGVLRHTESKPSTVANGSVTRVEAGGADQIAWVRWNATKWRLHLFADGNQLQAFNLDLQPLTLPASNLVNLSAGDYDGDGFEDLLFYETTTQYLVVFHHQASPPGYMLEEYYLVDDGTPDPVTDTAHALFADINNDWNEENAGQLLLQLADLIVVQESQGGATGGISMHVDLDNTFKDAHLLDQPTEPPPPPFLIPVEDYPPEYTLGSTQYVGTNSNLEIGLEAPHWATHIQVTAWRYDSPCCESGGSTCPVVDMELECNKLTVVDPSMVTTTVATTVTQQNANAAGQSWSTDELHYLQVRFLELDAALEIVRSTEVYLYAVIADETLSSSANYWSGLDCIAPPGAEEDSVGQEGVTTGGRIIGAIKLRDIKGKETFPNTPQPVPNQVGTCVSS